MNSAEREFPPAVARRGRPGAPASPAGRRPHRHPVRDHRSAGRHRPRPGVPLERDGGGFRLFYAIADLPSFVASGRGDRCRGPPARPDDLRGRPPHPAASHALSEDAASLLPDQVRAAFVWEFLLDASGRVTSTSVARARIRSRRQLDYPALQADPTRTADRCRLRRCCATSAKHASCSSRSAAARASTPEILIRSRRPVPLVRRELLPVENWNAQLSLMTGMAAATIMLDGGVGILRTMAPAQATRSTGSGASARARNPWPEGQPLRRIPPELDGTDPTSCRSCTPRRRCSAPPDTRRSTARPRPRRCRRRSAPRTPMSPRRCAGWSTATGC